MKNLELTKKCIEKHGRPIEKGTLNRGETIARILKIVKKRKVESDEILISLMISTDKEVERIYRQLHQYSDGDVVRFDKKIQLPDIYKEKTFIIPNSEYTIKTNKKKNYKGWIIMNGLYQSPHSIYPSALSFSPKEFNKLRLNIK